MAYSQYTLGSLNTQLGVILDDTSEKYWTAPEKTLAIQEALRVWGAYTNYWRARGTFNLDPDPLATPYYDLSYVLPALRTRTWTLDQVVRDIQYACLEAPGGIAGTGASGQISIQSILRAIQRARNRFVLDALFPLTVNPPQTLSPPPPDGLVEFSNTAVYVHRASWQDSFSGIWQNLWREDAWSADHSMPIWPLQPGNPQSYSESESSPLRLQLVPPPSNAGLLEVISVDSLLIDIADGASTFNLPDEWIHAVKWAALADLFGSESQNTDPLRAQYAETRYKQAIDFAKSARSIMRLTLESVPLPLDSLAAIDSGSYAWRQQSGSPQSAGALFDIVAVASGRPDRAYGITADVVRSAPIPTVDADPIQLGPEDIPNLLDYCTHVLTFKCGGNEFKSTWPQYDSWLGSVAGRKGVNKAKIRYLDPLLGQPEKEERERPDKLEATRA